MTNGTGFFNPTQYFGGFTPVGNFGWNNFSGGNWGVTNPGFTPYGFGGYPTNTHIENFGGFTPTGYQNFTGYPQFGSFTPAWNTFNGTPWQNFSPVSTFGGYGFNPTTNFTGWNGQYVPTPTNNGYPTGYGVTNPFIGGFNPTFNGTNNTVQPWNTFSGYNTPGFANVPFSNYVGQSGATGFVPQWNTNYNWPTATNFSTFLSNIAGSSFVNPFIGGWQNTGPSFFHPSYTGTPFNYVNGTPYGNIPAGYPVGNGGPIGHGPISTDVNGKVQTGTIGLARNAA